MAFRIIEPADTLRDCLVASIDLDDLSEAVAVAAGEQRVFALIVKAGIPTQEQCEAVRVAVGRAWRAVDAVDRMRDRLAAITHRVLDNGRHPLPQATLAEIEALREP